MKWAEHVASVVKKRGAYRVLVGKPDGNKPLGRYTHTHTHRWIILKQIFKS
jgi:hypothetical protein